MGDERGQVAESLLRVRDAIDAARPVSFVRETEITAALPGMLHQLGEFSDGAEALSKAFGDALDSNQWLAWRERMVG